MGVISNFITGVIPILRRTVEDEEAVAPAPNDLESRRRHFQSLVDQVEYPQYKFSVGESSGSLYLQITCSGVCNVTGAPMDWKSGKWLLSQHMLDSEVVQKCLKAVLTAVEHEAREQFKYRGRTIFDPHFDVEKLWELRGQKGSVVQRTSAPGEPSTSPMENTARSLMGLPLASVVRTASDSGLLKYEASVAERLQGAEDTSNTVVSGSMGDIHSEMLKRGLSWAYDSHGEFLVLREPVSPASQMPSGMERLIAGLPTCEQISQFSEDELRSAEENTARLIRAAYGPRKKILQAVLSDIQDRRLVFGHTARYSPEGSVVYQ